MRNDLLKKLNYLPNNTPKMKISKNFNYSPAENEVIQVDI